MGRPVSDTLHGRALHENARDCNEIAVNVGRVKITTLSTIMTLILYKCRES